MSTRTVNLEILAWAVVVVVIGVGAIAASRPGRSGPGKLDNAIQAGPKGPALPGAAAQVAVTPNESARRVDVTIGGAPFTAYIWPERLRKPVLYPIRAATGTLVTRGWPLDPRPGERVDHPHHVGLWLNYESVNGVDFWNNSDALKPADAAKMGTIFHRRIVSAKSGASRGELVTEMDWVMPTGKTILHERAVFAFAGDSTARRIERISTLTALDERVVFADAKDGMLGMRVARQLEQPSNEPQVYTDIAGRATSVPVMDNTGVTGEYTSSEGKKGDAVWSTRGRWTMLTGKIGDEAVTLAILDHPKNPGFPTYWHARGYGLFAANPLGQKVFSNGREALNFTLEPRASATFRYEVLVLQGTATPEIMEREYTAFAAAHGSTSSP
jgi:Methane oxygenase PmoA